MQTLGRFAIIGGTVLVALVNVILFRDVESLDTNNVYVILIHENRRIG